MSPLEQIADLADVPVDVEVELGRRVMTIAQILELGPDSVIRIARSAGDNIDILVGGTLIGYGEIVIIEDTVGSSHHGLSARRNRSTRAWISYGSRSQSHSVFALLWAALWVLKRRGGSRFQPGVQAAQAAMLESRGRLALTPQHSLHLVRIGDRELLLACASGRHHRCSATCGSRRGRQTRLLES